MASHVVKLWSSDIFKEFKSLMREMIRICIKKLSNNSILRDEKKCPLGIFSDIIKY